MTLRDQRQSEFANVWLDSDRHGILYLCPRFGKIYTAINILEKLDNPKVLIAYPDNKIKNSWLEDFEKRGYSDENISYTTFLSLKKHIGKSYDLLIIDEPQELSEAQIEACKSMFNTVESVLGLTGTLSKNTKRTLWYELELNVIAEYSIKQGIDEGVIPDYEIHIIKVDLDNIIKRQYKKKSLTEKRRFDQLDWVVNKKDKKGENSFFLKLQLIKILQRSLSKIRITEHLIEKYKDERILVFCGLTDVSDSLGIPSYHSKSTEKDVFDKFASGEGNHLAVVKIGNAGVTYKPLSKVIINYFDSNSENMAQKILRCMSMEYDNPEKKACIYIISSTEKRELEWLRKSLEFFDKSKITGL